MTARRRTWLSLGLVGLIVSGVLVALMGRASADTPLPTSQYAGFASTLARAPYITDLTQTSAYINWATTSKVPGSVQVAPAPGGSCPASTLTWSPSAAGAGTTLPGPVNPTSSLVTKTLSTWQFTVVATSEYQASVQISALTPGTEYCYAVFSTDTAGATDLLPTAEPDQLFTTLSPATTTATTPVSFDVVDDTGENFANATSVTGLPFGNGFNPDESSLYSQIGSSGAQFLIDAGDTAYTGGTETNFGDLQQTSSTVAPEVSNFFGPNYYPLAKGIPTFAAAGDHNQDPTTLKVWPTPTSAANSGGTYAFDSYTTSGIDGITTSAPDDWYAFSTGNVRVYVIDGAWGESATSGKLGNTTGALCGGVAATAPVTECQPYQADADEHWQASSPEYQWLAADLAAHPGGIKMAVFHFPLRSDSPSQPSDPYIQNSPANPNASTSLEALLSENGVYLAFNGHAHTYQRFNPSGPNQLISYVTGGGGGVPGPVDTGTTAGTECQTLQSETTSMYALGWSPNTSNPALGTGSICSTGNALPAPLSAADVYNYLNVAVNGNSVTVTPYNAAGTAFDVQTYTFNPAATLATPNPVTATATGTTSVQVTWSPSSGVDLYVIDRNGVPLATVPGTTTSYTDSSAEPSTDYSYTVTAVAADGTAILARDFQHGGHLLSASPVPPVRVVVAGPERLHEPVALRICRGGSGARRRLGLLRGGRTG